jgi:hypothetical protein
LSFWSTTQSCSFHELALQPEQLLEVNRPVDTLWLWTVCELGNQLVEAVIINLHLQLLVEAVDEIAPHAVVKVSST